MGYGYGDRFEVDPALHGEFTTEGEQIGKDLRSIAAGFLTALEPYSNWYGIDDDFAREAGPQYRKQIENVARMFQAAADGFDGVTRARNWERQKINKAQGFALDEIQQGNRATNNVDGNNGNGKH